MNDRFKKIANWCWDLRLDGPHFDQEKFARAIVNECIYVIEDAVNEREPASTYVSKLKQHFGVE